MSIRKWVAGAALIAVAAVALTMLFRDDTTSVSAHQDPADCTGGGLGIQVNGVFGTLPSTRTVGLDGETITYTISVSNQPPGGVGIACTITNTSVDITLPDGTVVPVPCGTGIIGCPFAASGSETDTFQGRDCEGGVTIPGGNTPPTIWGQVTYVADEGDATNNVLVALASTEGCAHTVGFHTNADASNPATDFLAVPELEVTKVCTTPEVTIGEDVVFTITVKNVSSAGAALKNVTVSDSLAGGVLAPAGAFDLAADNSAAGGPDEATLTYTVTTSALGQIQNVATATSTIANVGGVDLTFETTDNSGDPAICNVIGVPEVSIVKTAGTAVDGAVHTIDAGQTVVYHYEVCNTGDLPLVNTVVTDDNRTPANTADDFTIVIGNLAVGACTTVDSDPIAVPDTGTGCTTPTENIGTVDAEGDPGNDPVTDSDPALVCVLTPDISIVKTAGTAADGAVFNLPPGATVIYHYEVCNTGETALEGVTINDDGGPSLPGFPVINVGNLAIGACSTHDAAEVVIPTPPLCGTATYTNTATAAGTSPLGTVVDDTDPAEVCLPPPGGEGCTPGFWKNHTDLPRFDEAWPPTGYTINTTVESAFGVDVPGISSSFTLLQALNARGGGLNALLRHATASLLNSAHGDINFDMTEAEVIAAFQAAIAAGPSEYEMFKNIFAENNEDGCPINGKDPRPDPIV